MFEKAEADDIGFVLFQGLIVLGLVTPKRYLGSTQHAFSPSILYIKRATPANALRAFSPTAREPGLTLKLYPFAGRTNVGIGHLTTVLYFFDPPVDIGWE